MHVKGIICYAHVNATEVRGVLASRCWDKKLPTKGELGRMGYFILQGLTNGSQAGGSEAYGGAP